MISKRQLKSKILSTGNIRQMTRAMELVAATKMRKAQERALSARSYARHALSLLSRIVAMAELKGQEGTLWEEQKAGKICFVVVTSDKGLSGSFNNAILRQSLQFVQEQKEKGEDVDIVAVGKKARDFFSNRGATVAASFLRFSDIVELQDAAPLTDWLLASYDAKTYKRVVFCSTQFVSALLNRAWLHPVLPLDSEELSQIVENIGARKGLNTGVNGGAQEYLLEPSPNIIFENLSREIVRIAVLHLLFESNASEHSSRMLAMKNATENAEDILENLTLQLNKARQSAITQELSEVTGAKEALTAQ